MALLSVDEAQTRVLACANVTEAEWVAVGEAAGRTLAADLGARRTQPPLALSAMDGYAVRLAGIGIGVPTRWWANRRLAAAMTRPSARAKRCASSPARRCRTAATR